ncbi:hypothetical protein APSETT445_002835 [Aspergillus pseudonomiae]
MTQVDHAAKVIRDTLSHQSWLPSSVRPTPPPSRARASQSLVDRAHDWVLRNRAWSAAILAFVGTTSLLYLGNKKLGGRRRKARRAGNGARKEIVVVAGSPHEPMTKAIATDLERRGYIVYITVSSADEEQLVQSENRMDIRPLWLDVTAHSNIDVVELKLGNIDLGPQYRNAQSHITGTEVLTWTTQQRSLYGSQYLSSIEQRPVASAGPSMIRGSNARTLHYAVLDALEPASKDIFGRKKSKAPVIYAGRGAWSYSIVGDWAPNFLVGWMLGLRSGPITPNHSPSGSSSETSWEKV